MKKVALIMVLSTVFPRLLAAQDLDVRSLAGEHWYGLYLNGQKAGYACHALTVAPDGVVSVTEDSHFRGSMAGQPQDMTVTVKRTYAADGALVSVEQEANDAGGAKRFVGRVEADSMTLITEMAGSTNEQRLPKPKESLKDALKQIELIRKSESVGAELSFSLFEPMYAREVEGTSRIEAIEETVLDGVKTKVYTIHSRLPLLGVDSLARVAQDGTTLEDQVAGIITMRLESKEMAQNVTYSNDVIISNAATTDKPIDEPRTRKTLKLRVLGPLTQDHLLSDNRQQFEKIDGGAAFESRMPELSGFATAQVPVTDESVRQYINPSTFVQSDDPRLIAKAKEIVGEETDTFAISEKLCHWVKTYVKTTYSARLSNSLEVLDDPEGDCTEHSMLFIGLARAAGVPAREAAGLIYMNGDKPGFYFHQWASVWVGKWVDVDPTFDQSLADVTHIRLAEGDLFDQAKLIPVIGQLRIEVIE